MTLEELYNAERARIRKLALRYSRIFRVELEDLEQTGALAVCETHARYAGKVSEEELLRLSHRIVNRMMYRFAISEYRFKQVIVNGVLERKSKEQIN